MPERRSSAAQFVLALAASAVFAGATKVSAGEAAPARAADDAATLSGRKFVDAGSAKVSGGNTAGAATTTKVSAGSSAPATDAVLGRDLAGLLAYARDNSPGYAAMRHEAEAASARVGGAEALPDPMLLAELRDVTNEASGASPSLIPSRIGSARYVLSQSLPGWGKRDLRRAGAQASADEARLRAAAEWLEQAAQVKTAFAEYWRACRSLDVTRELRDLIARLERVAHERYANGLTAQQDVIRAQVEATNVEAEIAVLSGERISAAAWLNTLLPRPANAPLAVPEGLSALPPVFDYDTLATRLREKSPRLQAEGARREAAAQNRELTYRNRDVDWRVGVGAVQMENRIAEWELMLEVNLPLQQGSRRAGEREAEAMLAASAARRDATAQQLQGELGRALAGLQAAQRIATLTRDSLLPQARLNLQAALAGYETGKVDFATLLDAERQLRQARLGEIRAQAEARIRLAEIERIVGEE